MKNFKAISIISAGLAVGLLAVIAGPAIFSAGAGEITEKVSENVSGGALENSTGGAAKEPQWVEFDLKYDKYLIAEPYTYEAAGESRVFQFEKMLEQIRCAEDEFKRGKLTYIDNYKNRNGWAPSYHGGTTDASGNRRSAAAPGYPDYEEQTEFTYLSDGMLIRLLYEDEEYAKVETVADGRQYFVPEKYVPTDDCLTDLNKAIVVDRKNQNIASFEKRTYGGNNGREKKTKWKVVSYSLATTGKEGKYHQPTPLGHYYAIEKKPKFYYVKDGTDELEGSAPYAIRFSGGAYIHGVAVAFKYREDGSRIEGNVEYSGSIGTVPLSHKCVRNYTSHAKFLYDWYVHGETIVIVIE